MGMVTESQKELSDADISALVDNMDYDLLTRVDDMPNKDYQNACRLLRRQQYEQRIKQSQILSRLVLSILQGDASNATSRLMEMWELVLSSTECAPARGPFMEEIQATKTCSSSTTFQEPILWTESFSCNGADEYRFANDMWEVLLRLCGLAVLFINLNNQTASAADSTATAASIQTVSGNIMESLSKLQTQLCLVESNSSDKYLHFQPETPSVLLRPSWLHQVTTHDTHTCS